MLTIFGLQQPHSQMMMNECNDLLCFNRNPVLMQNKIFTRICMTPTWSFNKLPKQRAKTRVKKLLQGDRYIFSQGKQAISFKRK